MDFDTQFFVSIFPKLMLKIPYTLCLGCVAFAIAFVLGLFWKFVLPPDLKY